MCRSGMRTSSRLDPHESRDCARFRSVEVCRCAAYGWCKDVHANAVPPNDYDRFTSRALEAAVSRLRRKGVPLINIWGVGWLCRRMRSRRSINRLRTRSVALHYPRQSRSTENLARRASDSVPTPHRLMPWAAPPRSPLALARLSVRRRNPHEVRMHDGRADGHLGLGAASGKGQALNDLAMDIAVVAIIGWTPMATRSLS